MNTRPFALLNAIVLAVLVLSLSVPLPAHAGSVLHVAVSAGGNGDCSSWQNACAFPTALAAATSGDEIWVKAGTHFVDVGLKDGVSIYGGFAGSEATRSQRNWLTNVTILDGQSTNPQFPDEMFWRSHVVHAENVPGGVLDGFTIRNGRAYVSANVNGAGIYLVNSSPQLSNLIVTGNYASIQHGGKGGGLYAEGGSPWLVNVTFLDNRAGGQGGAVYAKNGELHLVNVFMHANQSGGSGGAILNNLGTLHVLNSTAVGNWCTDPGQTGWGLEAYAGNTYIRNSIFINGSGSTEINGYPNSIWISNSGITGGCPTGAACNNMMTGVPQFVNLYGDDLRLAPGSPGINEGNNTYLPADTADLDGDGDTTESVPYDRNGVPRVSNSTVDVGAFETLVATVLLSDLQQAYDGEPKEATVTTSPAGLAVTVTYNGSTTPPTAVGSYAVVATVNDATYMGSASGTLVIFKLLLDTLDQYTQVLGNTRVGIGPPSAIQTFTAGLSGPLTLLELGLDSGTGGAGAATLQIKNVATGAVLATASIPHVTIHDLWSVRFTTPPTVEAGTQYAIVLSPYIDEGSPINGSLGWMTSADSYAGGAGSIGSTSVGDFFFRTYVGVEETTVTIDQASDQADPTGTSPVNFTAVFSRPVTGFVGSDVTLGGSAGATTATVTEIAPNDGTTYTVAVAGMTGDGTVSASIAKNKAIDPYDRGTLASTSTDNQVTYYFNNEPAVNAGADASIGFGVTFNGSGSFTDADSDDSWTATVDYGDGSGAQTLALNSNKTFTLSHLYAHAGIYSVTVTVTDGLATASDVVAVTVQKANQTIRVGTPAPSTAVYGSSFTVAATASSGLDVAYSASGACSNQGGTFTMTSGTGACSVRYDQAGNDDYSAAAQVSESVTAGPASQAITFGALEDKTYGEAAFRVSATADSGLEVSFSASGPCTVSGDTVTITGAGRCTVTASQAGNENYGPATAVPQAFDVGPVTVTASITAQDKDYDGTPAVAAAGCTLSGVLPADANNIVCTAGQATFGTADAGADKTVTANVSLSGAAAGNYQLSAVTAVTTANIWPKVASVTPHAAGKIYGDDEPALTGSLTGFLDADGVTASYTRTAGEAAGGSYTISAELSPAAKVANYDITYDTATFTIDKRPLEVTADAKTKLAGDGDPELTYQITGGSLVFDDGFTGALMRDAGEAPGPYTIRQGELALNDNYILTYVEASLTIMQRPSTTTLGASGSFFLPGQPVIFNASVAAAAPATGTPAGAVALYEGDALLTQTVLDAGGQAEFAISDLAVGPHSIKAVYSGDTNWASSESGVVSIQVGKQTAAVTLGNTQHTYDGSSKYATATTEPAGLNVTIAYTRQGSPVANPTDAGTYSVLATVNDDYYEGSAGADLTITPAALAIAAEDKTINEGDAVPPFTVTYSGFVNNENPGVLQGELVCNAGTPPYNPGTRSITCGGQTSLNYTITWTSGILTIGNVAPTNLVITGPVAPAPMNTEVSVSATFEHPVTEEIFTLVWNWGDGTSNTTTTDSYDARTAGASHTYTQPGVFVVTVTVSDGNGDSVTASTAQYVVVYDPNGSFVTGGGWIISPAGAYPADPTLTGPAHFGFVSKYEKGKTVPSGTTEFQFQAGGLNFRSTVYEWLVISGARAQFKGSGTVNGSGDYGFLLSAIDGQITGGGGADQFRIKIWDKVTGQVVYDNQMGASDTGDPTTALGGGSIVIHAK